MTDATRRAFDALHTSTQFLQLEAEAYRQKRDEKSKRIAETIEAQIKLNIEILQEVLVEFKA